MSTTKTYTQFICILICIFIATVSCSKIDKENASNILSGENTKVSAENQEPSIDTPFNPHVSTFPHASMNMMNPASGQLTAMMNPHMYLNMMSTMMGSITNPMGINMMYPMMGMMGPMLGPMSGAMNMPGTTQMPSGQMMDPKQYEQWFNQMSEMMKNNVAQEPK